MKHKTIFLVTVLPLALLAGCGSSGTANNATAPSSAAAVSSAAALKIQESADAPYAYLISEDPASFDTKTKEALVGFTVDRKVLADGTKVINLVATDPEYQSQSYTIKPGQKLYFIERYLQDDQNGQEKNMKDDRAVVTESDGTIVQK